MVMIKSWDPIDALIYSCSGRTVNDDEPIKAAGIVDGSNVGFISRSANIYDVSQYY